MSKKLFKFFCENSESKLGVLAVGSTAVILVGGEWLLGLAWLFFLASIQAYYEFKNNL